MPRRKATSALKPVPVDRASRGANFFDLPAEIRNVIYELTFDGLIICYPKSTTSNPKGRATSPGVVMASRQTYQESLLLFYASANLHFEVADKMLSVLRKLGARKRALLKNDVFVDAVDEPLVESASRWQPLMTTAEQETGTLLRRMRDSGATLQPGILKLKVKCYWEGEMRYFLCWPTEDGVWCFGKLTIKGRDDLRPGSKYKT